MFVLHLSYSPTSEHLYLNSAISKQSITFTMYIVAFSHSFNTNEQLHPMYFKFTPQMYMYRAPQTFYFNLSHISLSCEYNSFQSIICLWNLTNTIWMSYKLYTMNTSSECQRLWTNWSDTLCYIYKLHDIIWKPRVLPYSTCSCIHKSFRTWTKEYVQYTTC